MTGFVTSVAIDDAFEIMMPSGRKHRGQYSTVCLCCERADQPMDDDGCGICDACLGLSVRENDALDGTVSSVIVGARNEEQLRQNLGAVGWNLTPEQIAKLDEASAVAAPYPYSPYRRQEGFARLNPPMAG